MRHLERRLGRIEARCPAVRIETLPDPEAETAKLYRLSSKLNILGYDTWRHVGLSLEERLAIARDDSAREQANPASTRSPGRWPNGQGGFVDRWPDIGAREFEIRILERDGRIDEQTARLLRDNVRDHFFEGTETLHDLPHPIDFDELVSLRTAREKCPRRESLPLEQQLEMEHEDHAVNVRDRIINNKHAGSANAPVGLPSLNAFQDKMHEYRVKELVNRIKERDRVGVQCYVPTS